MFAGAAVAIPLQRLASAQTALANRMPQSKLTVPFSRPLLRPLVAAKFRSDEETDYYKVPMVPFLADIIPGYQTPMYRYAGSFPGPTIRATRGRPTAVRFTNQLPSRHEKLPYEPYTSVQLHGSPSLPQYDGYASDITRPGEYKDYHYPGSSPATATPRGLRSGSQGRHPPRGERNGPGAARFNGRGKYMIHCHNHSHEDHEMMTQVEVVDPEYSADHPMSAPCRKLPEESEL